MLTGVCKLTVDAIVLAPRSFINFGSSNGSLHGYNLVVMAWQNNNILNCSRVLTKSYYTNKWVFVRYMHLQKC